MLIFSLAGGYSAATLLYSGTLVFSLAQRVMPISMPRYGLQVMKSP